MLMIDPPGAAENRVAIANTAVNSVSMLAELYTPRSTEPTGQRGLAAMECGVES